MPTIYEVYDGSNLSLKLINKTIGNSKQTSISLGDDNTKIYTKSSGTIQFTANLIIEKDLTVGSSDNSRKFNVYNQLGVNTPSFYNNVSAHIKNGNNPITNPPPSYTTQDLLLLENSEGSYLQLSSNNTTISGIGFSTTSARNKGSIEYNFNSNIMTFTANSSVFTFNGNNGSGNGILTVDNIINNNTFSSVFSTSNVLYFSNIQTPNISKIGTPHTTTADFTNTSIVVVKDMTNGTLTNITLIIPNITTSPNRMRVIYLLVKSNGNYTINSTTTGGGVTIRLPSSYAISPSSNGKYDMYSFLTNGEDAFCTFAYNYEFTSTGVLN